MPQLQGSSLQHAPAAPAEALGGPGTSLLYNQDASILNQPDAVRTLQVVGTASTDAEVTTGPALDALVGGVVLAFGVILVVVWLPDIRRALKLN
jgi:hypothetical protein